MMRLPTTVLNWILLGINMFMFVLLVTILLAFPAWLRWKVSTHRLLDGPILGMEVCHEMGPFVLLTGKDFPCDESFQLRQRCQPLNPSISVLDGKFFAARKAATKHVSMDVGPDFSVSCECSLADSGVDIYDLTLSHKGKDIRLTDLNVDGVFDVRQTRDGVCVWYQGVWREVDKDPKQDLLHKRLLDGVQVSFDTHSGLWKEAARIESH
jgi:hypothetical protein